METEIIVAIISAVAVIVAAIINKAGKRKRTGDKPIKIKQNAIGKDITQTGVQNNYFSEKKGDENA